MLNIFKIVLSAMIVLYFSACGGSSSSDDKPTNNNPTNPSTSSPSSGNNPTTISHNGFSYGIVSSPITGKQWLDRNLGASEVCTKSKSEFTSNADYVASQKDCFGDLYQWGRLADGHEKRDSSSVDYDVNLTIDNGIIKVIDAESDKFIKNSTSPKDWTNKDSDGAKRKALWSKTDGSSICPKGFRVPTIDELKAETIAYAGAEDIASGKVKVTNRDTAFKNFLKFPVSEYRSNSSASLYGQGYCGVVWSSSPEGSNVGDIYFDVTYAGDGWRNRAFGFSVRCIKD